jgi:anaerobic ribonucleoside-triphosphate reductase
MDYIRPILNDDIFDHFTQFNLRKKIVIIKVENVTFIFIGYVNMLKVFKIKNLYLIMQKEFNV